MIGYISGKIKFLTEDSAIVEVSGVGYKVEIGSPEYLEGQEVEFFIYTHVREQELRLFGFKTADELKLFEKLLTVSGVGPKVAMALVSTLGVDKIVQAITFEQPEGLIVSGVGKRTVEKIIVELKNKLHNMKLSSGNVERTEISGKLDHYNEAIDALVTLGFKRSEIETGVKEILQNNPEITTSQELIKHFLKK